MIIGELNLDERFEVRISDINYGGHMGNDRALSFFQDARIKYLRHFGFDEHHIAEGIGIILSESHVYYKKEVFLHDQLNAKVWIQDLKKRAFTMVYEFYRQSDEALVFEGSNLVYAFEYQSRKACELPENFINTLTSFTHPCE